jgi:GNAT superfamily N-acetyltransferase
MPMADIALIRDYRSSDAEDVNRLAVKAFDQFHVEYEDWPAMLAGLSRTASLSATGELVVAEWRGHIVGAVAYFGPHAAKAAFFDQSWPIIRMLVVDPRQRGNGIGRKLTSECIAKAQRDRSAVIALHTSPIMTVALPMYLRMGFTKAHDAPPIFGVPYAVYTKAL